MERSVFDGDGGSFNATKAPALSDAILGDAFPKSPRGTRHRSTNEGLDCAEVWIPMTQLWMPAYVARPNGASCRGVVIVIHDAFGPHAQLQDVCRRLAHLGYFAVLPAFFARDAAATPSTVLAWVTLAKALPDTRTLDDLSRIAAWSAQVTGATSPPLLMGFCWGGRIAWLAAARMPLTAAVVWYGYLRAYSTDDGAVEPVDVLGQVRAPVLGLYGGRDEVIPLADVETMRAGLASGASGSRLEIFPDAGHAFFSDHRDEHHPASSAAAWRDACAWFDAADPARTAAVRC